jgi:Zinc carboxypeptidase
MIMRVHALVLMLLLTAATIGGQAPKVPEPADVFGFRPGTDYKLATHAQIVEYFTRLDAASDRVVVEEIGRTAEGRPLLLALISSEANIKNRARYKEIARQLAYARGVDEARARALAKEGRAIVWIDGGLHATEVAHAQHTPEFGWWVATSETDEAKRMRENAILLLMPVMNPDGLEVVTNWYSRNLGTPFETTSPPVLYHHYIGHDNNRDWYMFTQLETQAVGRILYREWFPQIVYNHHQSSPFPGRIWGPPMENPVNPNLDPLIVSTINQIGEAMRKRFDEEEKPGYNSGIVFDMWWNGSMRGAPDFHNMAGFLTETAGYRYATPRCYTKDEIPDTFGERASNLDAKNPSTNYTNPWLGGCWPLRSAVDYMLTASRAVLNFGAALKEDFLFNIWRMGTRQIARGEKAVGGPFAYVIDLAAQHDPTATVEFLRTFRRGGVEIRQADAPFNAGGKQYPAGSYVIGPQAFRPYVIDLMEPKRYPDRRQYPGGPPEPPYDMTGYELGLQMGVTADRISEPFALPPRILDDVPAAHRTSSGAGEAFTLPRRANMAARAVNRLLKAGARVAVVDSGDFVVEDVARDVVEKATADLGVSFAAGAASGTRRALRAPRVGLYRSHLANMDEGWTRWVLEQYEFPYRTLTDADIRRGDFAGLDIILLPDEGDDQILNGHRAGTMPPEFVGGIGVEGASALKRFVENGGWVYAWDGAADFAIATFGLPLRNTVRNLPTEEFFIPGSLVNLETKPASLLAAGMAERAIAFFVQSQAFTVIPGASEGQQRVERDLEVFATYAAKDFLASGWELGGRRFAAGRPAGVRVPVGKGQVVVLAFRPHFRGQPHNTFKLLFNPIFAAATEGAFPPRPTSSQQASP